MVVKCFLKHKLPFQYDLATNIPKKITVMKLKTVNQRFELEFKSRKKDYTRVTKITRERRLACIEGREPNKGRMEIFPIQVTFPRSVCVMKTILEKAKDPDEIILSCCCPSLLLTY
jgi:hypothetical protein